MNIRRILVALDASPHSLAALDSAAEMAARLEVELLGLFVEDINLLRLAEFPFAREVGFPSAVPRPLNSATMERTLKIAAEQARQAMETLAEHLPVRWSFRIVRGSVMSELLAAAGEADLVALGKAGRQFGTRFRLRSTAAALMEKRPCALVAATRSTASWARPCRRERCFTRVAPSRECGWHARASLGQRVAPVARDRQSRHGAPSGESAQGIDPQEWTQGPLPTFGASRRSHRIASGPGGAGGNAGPANSFLR
jgi:nucleotide-binding universal stress UspA family protein